VVSYLDTHLNMPHQHLLSLRTQDVEGIEQAADRTRAAWGLGGDVPIKNVTRAVENAGVPVTRFDGLSDKVDAFSHFGQRSLIVLNDKAPSRTRWDIAHECGHLSLHVGADASMVASLEAEAHRFAGAFLLPRAGFVREFSSMARWNWESLLRLKMRWRVSLAALVRRAFDLRLIDALRYRYAYKYMSVQGWLRHEPDELEAEEPELIHNAFTQLAKIGTSASDVAAHLFLTVDTLRDVVGPAIIPDEPVEPRSRNVIRLPAVRPIRRRQRS
jgi:Zn-dependent peptidase ImmA (M78 family)